MTYAETTFPSSRMPGRLTALFLVTQFVLMWAAFFILFSAINWPASLDDPAAIALPRLVQQAGAVAFGYSCYLLVALLLVPATAALNARLNLSGGLAGATLALATLAAMAKAIGICRWLFAMPGLAEAYVAPAADQAAIALVFQTLDAFAGGIGEIIGVGLIGGVWTLLIGACVYRAPGIPAKALGVFACVAGLSLFASVPAAFGVDLGPILTFSNIAWQFALLGIGLWALTPPRAA